MNEQEKNVLIQTWIAHHKELVNTGEINDGTFWVYEKLDELCWKSPDMAWTLILEILKTDQSHAVVANLAAGPVEDLLAQHGLEFIDKVEAQAKNDPLFKHLLGGVWQNDMPDEIWNRVEAAAGEKW